MQKNIALKIPKDFIKSYKYFKRIEKFLKEYPSPSFNTNLFLSCVYHIKIYHIFS